MSRGDVLERLDHTVEDLEDDTCACGSIRDDGHCPWCNPADGVQYVPARVAVHYREGGTSS